MEKMVFINPGHGGNDPGAVANNLKEKDLNLTIALSCRDELERHGVSVVMGRTEDVNKARWDIIETCNSSDALFAVDIHNNAGGGNGAEAYYRSKDSNSKKLATNILTYIKEIGQNSRGTKTKLASDGSEYYYFIREISIPAVIVECAFLDNKTDVTIIDTVAEQKTFGVAIAKGILKTLGIEYKTATPKATFKKGDKVKVTKAVTYDGKSFKTYYDIYDVIDAKGDRVVIGIGKTVTAAVNAANLTTAEPAKKEIKVGSTVKVKKGAKTFSGGNLASFVYKREHKVKEISGDRVVITYRGTVAAAVRKTDLIVIE